MNKELTVSQKNIKYLSIDLIDTKDGLNNLIEIYTFMDKLLSLANLKEIQKPVLIPYYHGKVKRDAGVSCYAFFEGGYCTLHIFEKRKIAYLDVISNSQEFDNQIFIKNSKKYCGTENILINTDETISENINKHIFGPHYICFGKPKKKFDTDSLISLQESIIKEVGMTPIITPNVLKNENRTLLFIAIAESHIALELSKNNLRIDIFSCKMFDLNLLKRLINKVIKLTDEKLFYRLYKS